MKYGESSFDIIYLTFALVFGLILIIKHKNRVALLFGIMALILGVGDAFHLIPRVVSYFVGDELILYKGIGKFVTSISMTIFYSLLEFARIRLTNDKRKWPLISIGALASIRLLLCAFPQNEWLISPSSYLWGIIRNVPFAAIGVITIILWFNDFRDKSPFKIMWLLVALSFAFYLVTVLGAAYVPMLGMMMLPKTICSMLMIISFYRYNRKEE